MSIKKISFKEKIKLLAGKFILLKCNILYLREQKFKNKEKAIRSKSQKDVMYVSCKAKYNNKNQTLMVCKRASNNN